MAKPTLTPGVTKVTDATDAGFRYPGSYSKNHPTETHVTGPGALRVCPGLNSLGESRAGEPKGAWRREPSSEPPDYAAIRIMGTLEMGSASQVFKDNVTAFLPVLEEKLNRKASACEDVAPPEPVSRSWSLDQIGTPVNGLAMIEAVIPLETLNGLMLLLQHPGYVVVALEGGGIGLDRVPPVMGEKLIK